MPKTTASTDPTTAQATRRRSNRGPAGSAQTDDTTGRSTMPTTHDDVRTMMATALDWSRFGIETMLDAQREWLRLGAAQTATAVALTRDGLELAGRAADEMHAGCTALVDQARDSVRAAVERAAAAQ